MKKQIFLAMSFLLMCSPIFAKKNGHHHFLKRQMPEEKQQMIRNVDQQYEQKKDQIEEKYRSQKNSLKNQMDQVKRQMNVRSGENVVTVENSDLIIQYLNLKQERDVLKSNKKCEVSVIEKEKAEAVKKIIVDWLQSIKSTPITKATS